MEQTPADARAAPSASAPNDIVMGIQSSPKRPRDPAQGNMVSQRKSQAICSSDAGEPACSLRRQYTCPVTLPEPARALHITPPLCGSVVLSL
eukprot:scaffold6667_cov111-Isochrysis_galbana.AAC.5